MPTKPIKAPAPVDADCEKIKELIKAIPAYQGENAKKIAKKILDIERELLKRQTLNVAQLGELETVLGVAYQQMQDQIESYKQKLIQNYQGLEIAAFKNQHQQKLAVIAAVIQDFDAVKKELDILRIIQKINVATTHDLQDLITNLQALNAEFAKPENNGIFFAQRQSLTKAFENSRVLLREAIQNEESNIKVARQNDINKSFENGFFCKEKFLTITQNIEKRSESLQANKDLLTDIDHNCRCLAQIGPEESKMVEFISTLRNIGQMFLSLLTNLTMQNTVAKSVDMRSLMIDGKQPKQGLVAKRQAARAGLQPGQLQQPDLKPLSRASSFSSSVS